MILHVAPKISAFRQRINNDRKQNSKNRTFDWPSPITYAKIQYSRVGLNSGNSIDFWFNAMPAWLRDFTVTQISYLSHAFIRNNIYEFTYNFTRKWEQLVFAIRDQRSISHFAIGSVSHSTFSHKKIPERYTCCGAHATRFSMQLEITMRFSVHSCAMYIFLFCSMR